MEPVEEAPVDIAMSTWHAWMAKRRLPYYSQHIAQLRYEEAAGYLSLLKMTCWNVSAVVWLGRVSQIILPEILSLGQNVCTCILLQHSGIDRTLHYCWGPVSSFKECVWLAVRDISSLYGRLIPKENNRSEWDLVYSLYFLLSWGFLGSFHLKSQETQLFTDKLGWEQSFDPVIYSILLRCECKEIEHKWGNTIKRLESFCVLIEEKLKMYW